MIEGLFDGLRDTVLLELPCLVPEYLYKTHKLEDVEVAERILDKPVDAVHVSIPQPPAHGHHGGLGGKPNKLVTPKLEIGIGPDKFGFWKDNWTM